MISSTLPKKKFRLPKVEPRQHFEITMRSTINKHKKHKGTAWEELLILASHDDLKSRLVHTSFKSRSAMPTSSLG
ncbi:hypothetical protein GW17_00012285 [Ensete ventricosum]|uniref:Uncharacterized protein n=1 Tax=Ensete ventricosum TaxID=4639 RepID=A0A444FLG1_ENSVE|nr:hypothetical protein GW17_00012285 [Ensete ventricosum]RZR71467.1 hypothetical protein BHM03_00005368 [Ensete ventricosum]